MNTPTEDDIRRAERVARRVASRQLRGHAWEGIDVEDIIQEVLLRFAQLDSREIANLDAWVTAATRNRCYDVTAAARRHDQRELGTGPNPDVVAVDRGRSIVMGLMGPSAAAISPMMLAHALEGLSERQKRLLRAHGDGWTNAELAQQFGYASAPSVAVAISRAKSKVRERFAGAHQRRGLIDHPRVY